MNIPSYENESIDVDSTSERLHASNILDNVYEKSVILEGKLSSAEMQAHTGNIYGNLQFAFQYFRNILDKLANYKKCLLNPNDYLL